MFSKAVPYAGYGELQKLKSIKTQLNNATVTYPVVCAGTVGLGFCCQKIDKKDR
jgi:hypothetical protein